MPVKAKKSAKNYLDYIPLRNPNFSWRTDEDGAVTVTVPHNGVYDRIAQRFFHRPKASQIHLDQYGSFIWGLIDGKHSVYEISGEVSARFGEAAEPLYNRLVAFFRILKDQQFILWR